MSVSHIIANRQTWFGHGSIQQLPPLLLADPQPTLLFSCRSFSTARCTPACASR